MSSVKSEVERTKREDSPPALLLETVGWDDEIRKVIERNQADGDGHISRWRSLPTAHRPPGAARNIRGEGGERLRGFDVARFGGDIG